MAKSKKMTDKQVRKWYQDHGIEYIPSDWDDSNERRGLKNWTSMHIGREPVYLWGGPFPDSSNDRPWWHARTAEEKVTAKQLEAFFAPYIAMLPRGKGELIRELVNDRKTYDQIAEDNKFYDRSHAHRALRRAVQALVLLIAKDDPDFVYHGRPRDYEAEQAAAERVFDRYMKGGTDD